MHKQNFDFIIISFRTFLVLVEISRGKIQFSIL